MTIDFTPPDCMFEELKANRNAILSFNLKTGEFTVDETTGNQIPEITTSEFEAIVHSTRRPDDATDQFYPGKNKQSQWFRGRILIPNILPKSIKHLSRGIMKIGVFDENNSFTELRCGDLILYNPNLNPYTKGALGTKFYGVFLDN